MFGDIPLGKDLATRAKKLCSQLMPRSLEVRTLLWVWNHPGEGQAHIKEELGKLISGALYY